MIPINRRTRLETLFANFIYKLNLDIDKIKQLVEEKNLVSTSEETLTKSLTSEAFVVLDKAKEEAHRYNHNYIGSEHLLLGLLRSDDFITTQVFRNLRVELSKARNAVEFIMGKGDRIVLEEKLLLTPRSKKIIQLAQKEAVRFGNNQVKPHYILLGILLEGEGIAAGVLESLGVSLERAEREINLLLGREKNFN